MTTEQISELLIQASALYGAVVLIATQIVKWTPSQKDDAILAKIVEFLNHFSTVNPKK